MNAENKKGAPAAGKGVGEPAGWNIRRRNGGLLITGPGGMSAHVDESLEQGIAGAVLHALAKELLSSTAALTRQPVAGDGMVGELVAAVTELRQRQRDYLSGPKGERSEEKGRLVGAAAARVDAALVPFRLEAMSQATARALAAVSGECQPVTLPNRSAKLSHDDYDWMYGIAPAATPTDGGEG